MTPNLNSGANVASPGLIAIILIAGSMIIPSIGLLGWLSKVLLFASFGENNIPMVPSTAICFLLLSFSTILMFRPTRLIYRNIIITIAGSIISMYGLLTFIGLTTGLPIVPDNFLPPIMGSLHGIPMGRMAPSTALLFVFSGMSLLFSLLALYRFEKSSLLKFWAVLLGSIIVFIGFVFSIAYMLNLALFYGGETIPMALTTSITFILSGSALIMIQNSQNDTLNHSLTMLKNIKIETQLKFGFAVLLLFVILLGTISYQQSHRIHQQIEDMYNHPLQVRRSIGELTSSLYSIRVDIKNLVLIDLIDNIDRESEQAANEISLELSNKKVDNEIEILRKLYLGPINDIDSLEFEFVKWKSIRKETIRIHKAGQIQQAAERSTITGVGGQQAQIVLKSLDRISLFASDKGDEFYAASIDLENSLHKQLFILVAIIMVISLIVSRFLMQAMRKPIKELINATKSFQGGNVNARSSYTSQNEFGELSNSYNTLADSIQQSLSLNEKIENISGLMLSEDDAKIFFQKTLNALSAHTDSQIAAVYLLNDENKSYDHFESIGLETNAKQSFTAENFEGEFGSAISSRKIQHIKNIADDTRFTFYSVTGKFIPREILTIPIQANNEVIAIISLASLSIYSKESIQLIDKILNTLSARVAGILSYVKIKEFSAEMELQNTELEASKTELSSQSAELTEQNTELELQKKQLSQANQLKTSFFSNMSHELRTPLNSVIALSGVLNRRLDKKIPQEEYSYLQVIERNGKLLLNLINDILDIARIEAGHDDIEITEFNANDCIDDIINSLSIQANQKNIELIHSKIDSELFINSDIKKYRHILMNIISNAVKFTEKGKVEVSAKQDNHDLVITVSDTGIGISKEQLTYVFDEFKQADSSTSRKFGGTGLGLSIAKKYTNMLGGNIFISSEIGKGSIFTLTLPLKHIMEGEILDTETLNFPGLGTAQFSHDRIPNKIEKTILLVDDSEPALIQMTDVLEEGGYHILIAHDGSEALAIIENETLDAVILDLMMPEIDGFQVLKSIREQESISHLPVLILTAKHITKEELTFLKSNNISQLIQKGDVNPNQLLGAVANMLFPEKEELKTLPLEPQSIKEKPLVLIVEDNPDNMISAKAVLSDAFTVLEAVDGIMAVEMAKKFNPNLILMDLALPKLDGIEAFKMIRKNPELEHIKIIALTASAMTQDREAILAHGFDAFIPKPIDEKQFFTIINSTLYGQ